MTIKEMLTQSLEKAFKDAGKIENPTERVAAYNTIADNCIKVLGLGQGQTESVSEIEESAAKPAVAVTAKTKSTAKSKTTAVTETPATEPSSKDKPVQKAATKTAPEPSVVDNSNTAVSGTVEEPTTDTESVDPNSFTEEWNEAAFTYFENELNYIQEIANQFVSSGNRPALITMLEAATDGQVHDSDGITPLNVRLIYDYLNAQVQAKQG